MNLRATSSTVNRSATVAAVVLLVGLATLAAGVAPTFGCEPAYALETTERPDVAADNDSVVAVSALPPAVGNLTRDAIAGGDAVPITEPAYKAHLADRFVAHDGSVYATELVATTTCGGTLEDALVVLGSILSTIGVLAVIAVALYGTRRTVLTRLHVAAAVALVLGAACLATGAVAPANCEDNYALETTERPGGAATDEQVVAATALPPDLEAAVERSVTTNQTAFLDRAAYREHLENNSVSYEGTVYDADIVLVQDCGGGLDDALLILGLALATLGAAGTALLVLHDHGERIL
jgi:hypothetical protein